MLKIENGIVKKNTGIDADVAVPEGVFAIGKSAFEGSKWLRSVSLPDTLMEIDYNAFGRCQKLEQIFFSNGLRLIGNSAFYECRALVRVVFPDSLTKIQSHAFQGCTNLQELALPHTLESIGASAFADCPNLHTIHIRVDEKVITLPLLNGAALDDIEWKRLRLLAQKRSMEQFNEIAKAQMYPLPEEHTGQSAPIPEHKLPDETAEIENEILPAVSYIPKQAGESSEAVPAEWNAQLEAIVRRQKEMEEELERVREASRQSTATLMGRIVALEEKLSEMEEKARRAVPPRQILSFHPLTDEELLAEM